MGMRLRAVSVTVFVLLTVSSALLLTAPPASAASKKWTTDTDFTAAGAAGSLPIFNGVEVVGTGVPAAVQLLKDNLDWKNNNPSTNPSARESPGLAYSVANNLVVLFGGYDGFWKDDTWEYNFGTNTWSQVTGAPKPQGREGPGMSYDPVKKVVVLFGGTDGTTFLTDTLEYDVTAKTWALKSPAPSPPPMEDTPLVYDSARQTHILVGLNTNTQLIETWEYNAATTAWANRAPSTRPTPRVGHAIAYHAARARTVLFGGADPAALTIFGDTWEYDSAGNSWSQRSPATSPSARVRHVMTYKPSLSSALLFGGLASGAGVQRDTWSYDATGEWSFVGVNTMPPARQRSSFTYHAQADVAVLFAGVTGTNNLLGDTWTLGAAFRAAGKYTSAVFDGGAANVIGLS